MQPAAAGEKCGKGGGGEGGGGSDEGGGGERGGSGTRATRAVAELWGCGAVNLLGAVLSRSSRLVDTPALPLHLG